MAVAYLDVLGPRFTSKVAEAPSGCWEWQGAKSQGYGYFAVPPGKQLRAHRMAYEALVGPIPEGKVLDHLCRNRACVNPSHLDVTTRGENVRRGAKGVLKTHCPQGHEYSESNTYLFAGRWRQCKQCNRDRSQVHRTAHRDEINAKRRGKRTG